MKHKRETIAQRVAREIAAGRVRRIPRWRFALRNAALWGVGALLVGWSALLVALMVMLVRTEADDVMLALWPTAALVAFAGVVASWGVTLALFLLLAQWVLRRTRRAYRLALWQVLLLLGAVSVAAGVLLAGSGAARRAEALLTRVAPLTQAVRARRQMVLHQPARGRIMGRVRAVRAETLVLYNRPTQQVWHVRLEALPQAKRAALRSGQQLVFLGAVRGAHTFAACDAALLSRRRGDRAEAALARITHASFAHSCATLMDAARYEAIARRLAR